VEFSFYKYQATGNDFILADNRSGRFQLSLPQVQQLCDRHFGIGADGLMLVESHPQVDFKLVYYNSDGTQSLCGNGSRAAVDFAQRLGLAGHHTVRFEAFDGMHEATRLPNGHVRLKMNDVTTVRPWQDGQFIHTGSPHVLQWVQNIQEYPVVEKGAQIRYHAAFAPGGTNVNFLEPQPDGSLYVRTYERGVEAETLSCGTGVTAAALAAANNGFHSPVRIQTKGGELQVEFKIGQGGTFSEIFLIGPAKMVFQGTVEL
jgi:diaminopimelate epimerase